MELFELMSQQATTAKNARRARRQLAVIWLGNRLLIVLAIAVSTYLALASARFAKHTFGVAGAALAALLVGAAAVLGARALRASAFVRLLRVREQAARAKLVRRRESLRTVTELLKSKGPSETAAE